MRFNSVSRLCFVGVTALFLAASTPVRADLVGVNIFDNTVYQQTSSAAPASPSGFFFNAGGNYANHGDFTTATVTDPSTHVTNLTVDDPSLSFNFGSPDFATLAGLHATYPFGTYTFNVSGGSAPAQAQTLAYLADAFTADIPALDPSTYTGLQGMNPAAAFNIDFNSFTPAPGVSEGITFFTVHDPSNNIVVNGGFLPPTATGVFVAANTLLPNTTYTYELDFSDRIDGQDPATGVFTEEGFDVRTDGSFTTGDAVAPVPEPASLALLVTVAGALFWLRRRPSMNRA